MALRALWFFWEHKQFRERFFCHWLSPSKLMLRAKHHNWCRVLSVLANKGKIKHFLAIPNLCSEQDIRTGVPHLSASLDVNYFVRALRSANLSGSAGSIIQLKVNTRLVFSTNQLIKVEINSFKISSYIIEEKWRNLERMHSKLAHCFLRIEKEVTIFQNASLLIRS